MFTFRSQITVKTLGYFFLNPDKKLYINELAAVLEVDPGNLFRKLKELEAEGILIAEKRGNQKYYGLNKKYPLLREIKKTYEAKYGLVNILKKNLSRLKGLEEAYIFGSYARDTFQQESDIDLLLVGRHSSLEAKRLVVPMQKEIGREINIVDLTPEELKTRRRKEDAFIRHIFSEKIIKVL